MVANDVLTLDYTHCFDIHPSGTQYVVSQNKNIHAVFLWWPWGFPCSVSSVGDFTSEVLMKELGVMWRVSFSSFSLRPAEPAWLLWRDPTPPQTCLSLITSRHTDDLSKCEQILIIPSLLHSEMMNCGKRYYIIWHLASNLLPCEMWMFSCTALQGSHSIQFKGDVKLFVYSKCLLRRCHLLDHVSMPFNLQYYSMCSKYPLSAHTHALSSARLLSMDASMKIDALFNVVSSD